jgi:hypothetical protein
LRDPDNGLKARNVLRRGPRFGVPKNPRLNLVVVWFHETKTPAISSIIGTSKHRIHVLCNTLSNRVLAIEIERNHPFET